MEGPTKKQHRKKSKLLPAVAAGLAVAMIAAGTLAYTNFLQHAVNEFEGFVNHGVRLHDDYREVYNQRQNQKDVYVENYGDSPLLVRVRLDEYYKLGSTVKVGTPSADFNDPTKGWRTYDKDSVKDPIVDVLNSKAVVGDGDWEWVFGGQKYYLPTENIDDTDPDADNLYDRVSYDDDGDENIEGSATEGDKVTLGRETLEARPLSAADEYVIFTNNVFPSYDESAGDGHDPIAPYTNKTVKQTEDATVTTMAKWIADGKKSAPVWVFDEDGWFYWAQPLESDTATGMLLSQVNLINNKLLDSYEYGINAVLQAVTWDERYAFVTLKDTSLDGEPVNHITTNARSLLAVAADNYAFALTATQADVDKVFADATGVLWRVVGIDEDKKQALVLREKLLAVSVFGAASATWANATLVTNLNTETGDYDITKPAEKYVASLGTDLTSRLVTNEISTATANNDTTFTKRATKIFLLSEYDVLGTAARANEATLPGIAASVFATDVKRIAYDENGVAQKWWTRSTSSAAATNVIFVAATGIKGTTDAATVSNYVRPAMFLDITVHSFAPPPVKVVTVTGLDLIGDPDTLAYEEGEDFDLTGLEFQVTFSDGTDKTYASVSDILVDDPSFAYTVSPSPLTIGTTQVVITHTASGASAIYDGITVTATP